MDVRRHIETKEHKEKLSKSQLVIAKQSPAIIKYLEQVVKDQQHIDPSRHIGHSFRANTNKGRVFNQEIGVPTVEIDKVIEDKAVYAKFDKEFKKVKTGNTLKDIETIKDYIEYFFRPIEESNEWKAFWKEQKIWIEEDVRKQNPSAEEEDIKNLINKEINKVRNQIASALAYRIQGNWSKKNVGILTVEKVKIVAITNTTNMLGEARENIGSASIDQNEKEKSKLKDQVDVVIEGIVFNNIKPEDVYEHIKNGLKQVRQHAYFTSLENAEEYFYEYIREAFEKLANWKYNETFSKYKLFFENKEAILTEVAKGILADMHTYHYKEVKSTHPRPADYILETLKVLTPEIGIKDKNEKHKRPYELTTAYITHWAPLYLTSRNSLVAVKNPLFMKKPPKPKTMKIKEEDDKEKREPTTLTLPEARPRGMTRSLSTGNLGTFARPKEEEEEKTGELEIKRKNSKD